MRSNTKPLLFGSLILTTVAIAVILMVRNPGSAEAQSGTITSSTTPPNTTVTYSSSYINLITASQRGDEIREIIPFPFQPVFLVRTKNALSVWVRNEKEIKSLQQIDISAGFESVTFLDDRRTYVVLTGDNARVYTLDRSVVRTPEGVTRR